MANYSDGTVKPVTDYVTNPAAESILSTIGTQIIDVAYTDDGITQHANYNVEVGTTTPVLDHLSLNTSGAKTTFSIGEAFSSSGLVVVGVYNTGNETIPSGSYTVSAPDMYSLGKHTVPVSYGGKTSTYEIYVSNAEAIVGDGSLTT
ncbi:MAG: bacterial Ig-like domain-containing protein, partial [Firmicutes bacterium]|nr:bacterial Ig-like domain-containing protein [Bacillota bacterium]